MITQRALHYFVPVVFLVLFAFSHAIHAQHSGDVWVGRTAAAQLKTSTPSTGGYVPELNIKVLPPVSGTFNGWADNNPGLDRIINAQPENDFLTLQTGCQVRLQVVLVDPAFQAISPSFAVIDDPGESFLLGNQSLHSHPTWLINSNHPQFDPLKVLWRATFRLVDTGGTAYTPSPDFTFHFANVACMRGDCNADGNVDSRDIADFVATVLAPASRTAAQRCSADIDRDGYAREADVAPFVDRLLAQ